MKTGFIWSFLLFYFSTEIEGTVLQKAILSSQAVIINEKNSQNKMGKSNEGGTQLKMPSPKIS